MNNAAGGNDGREDTHANGPLCRPVRFLRSVRRGHSGVRTLFGYRQRIGLQFFLAFCFFVDEIELSELDLFL